MNLNDDFVEIDGRQVPTCNGLRKMKLLVPNEDHPDDDEYGTLVTVRTPVIDDDYWLTLEQVRTIVWNLKKYSSATFMKQLREMLAIIAGGYEKHLEGRESYDIDIENITNFYNSIALLDKVIDLRLKGDANAYALLSGVHKFDDGFTGRKGNEYDWTPLGAGNGYEKKSIGLFLWIEKAINMAFSTTRGGIWYLPSRLIDDRIKFDPPQNFKYEPSKQKVVGRTGGIIPFTGIWNPFDFKSGCPSFLLAGQEFPKIDIATLKSERSEYVDNDGEYHKAWIDFDYEERETQWEILWEDNRYLDGKIPAEEVDYLDESCNFPTEPPEAIQN